MKSILVALLLSQSPEPSAAVKVAVKVGEQQPSPLAFAIGVTCDDRTVVEVIDAGDKLLFKGLKPGMTLCALGRAKLPPLVVEITVSR